MKWGGDENEIEILQGADSYKREEWDLTTLIRTMTMTTCTPSQTQSLDN